MVNLSVISTIIVQAAMISALYALIAIGFTLIFGVGGVLNLAHGATITMGAFSAYYAGQFGLGVPGAVLASVTIPALFAGVLYLGMVKRLEDEPIMVMITTLVVSVVIEQAIVVFEGTTSRALPPLIQGQFSIAGSTFQNLLGAMFVVSWLLIGLLFLFVNYTKTGKGILAVSMSHKGASLVGIKSSRINLITWIIAGAFAGIAGLFLGSWLTADFAMGQAQLVLSFSIVVVGGIGSIRGSVIGAYLIGFLEIATTNLVSSSLQGLAPLVVLVVVLLVKPEGLFGREFTE
ncbi:amino acid/amide ABC transporter membrane protein 1, HAAT family [Halorientalis persicus]|uniref:Amino acid/amide ABC transporter membrane protein 1, HAAT family n=1 Tax=Halorientalis persicus TaxID=1367881 RepID=A0A1H8UEX5_9EURY|nr:branched-chain amino acid ABC transporter permease [Halorientalis persicus]SEP01587.1 amino acid/amide ABC transporter membrane protein 1, HAAT family [Halorientalis persicus]